MKIDLKQAYIQTLIKVYVLYFKTEIPSIHFLVLIWGQVTEATV